eukprot:TRINITY_DN2226_c0_g1_i1.p1 TRINITY_DN2226_c0_g1~~TRINITY_DN2226_c0_g1_i1.p1  ORF type:complete len:288 (+),score=62.08 TRINITY_DN2226_c0_g1_i1:48-911(+)
MWCKRWWGVCGAESSLLEWCIQQDKVDKQEEYFVCPDWAGLPAQGTHLEVRKDGKVIDVVLIDKLPYYLAGRLGGVVDICLEHKSTSRAHCVFVHHRKGNLYLIDLNSNHGVFVNDERIAPKKTIKVTEDDEIRIGASTRLYKLNRKPPQKLEAAKVDGQRPAKRAKIDPVRVYHVLLKHVESRNPKSYRDPVNPVKRTKEEAISLINQFKEKIEKADDPFSELKKTARELSDCSSAKNNGDIGFITKGKMLKEVEQAAFQMKQGEFSGPVCSDSGVHLLYRAHNDA